MQVYPQQRPTVFCAEFPARKETLLMNTSVGDEALLRRSRKAESEDAGWL